MLMWALIARMARLKNKRWERFCREYVKREFNASAAARAVGYSVISARQQGHILMTKPDIQRRVNELVDDINDDSIMTAEEVLFEASKLAGFDLADCYDEQGRIIPIEEMDERVTTSINEIEVQALEVDGQIVNVPTKIKAGRDKKYGLELLSKYHNLLEAHQKAGAAINTIYIDEKDAQV